MTERVQKTHFEIHHANPSWFFPILSNLVVPAIGFISYVKLTGGIDAFAVGLYSVTFFLFLFVCAQWRLFRKIEFSLSWWAYSFSPAALDLATVLYFHKTGLCPAGPLQQWKKGQGRT
jgi:tellurite resistance protein